MRKIKLILKKTLRYGWPSFVIAAIIFYLSCLLQGDDIPDVSLIPNADKIVHFCMYFGLAIVASTYYIFKKKGRIKLSRIIIFAVITPMLYGGLIEILQGMFFERTADWFDFAANTLGVLVALPCALWFRKYMLNKQNNRL